MVKFIKRSQKYSKLSELFYVILNLGLVSVIFFLTAYAGSLLAALLFVLLSKWRIFAVRPRYWMANILANTVDTVVGVSLAVMMYQVGELIPQVILAGLYFVWLMFIKPRSGKGTVKIQAGISFLFGLMALSSVLYRYDLGIVVGVFVIAFSSARHILAQYEEKMTTGLSLVWALLVAQIAWVYTWWMTGYEVLVLNGFYISQMAILLSLVAFASMIYYENTVKQDKVHDLVLPMFFSVTLILTILLFFNDPLIGG